MKKILPGRGVGNRWSLKEFFEYRCVVCLSRLLGTLMMVMASKGHFFTQIPQPMQSSSDSEAIFESGDTSIHNFPIRTTGHDFLHSWRHRFGLHLSELTMAIRVCLSVSSLSRFRDILFEKVKVYV